MNIALVTNGIPQLGVIYVPATKMLYFADVNKKEGFKAELNTHNTTLKNILDCIDNA